MIAEISHGARWPAWVLGLCLLLVALPGWADSSAEYLVEGRDYLAQGKIRAAIIQFKNAVKEDPKNAEARFELGRAYLLGGDGAGAGKELERARRLGIGMERVASLLGRAYLMQGKVDKVLAEFETTDGLSPQAQAAILVARANARAQKRELELAGKVFGEALAVDPRSVDALLGLGRLAALQGRLDEALERADQVLLLDVKNSDAWVIKAGVARQRGDTVGAAEAYDKALALQPFNPSALLGSATVNLARGNADKADEAIGQLLRQSPGHLLANYLHAVSLYGKGKPEEALETLQRVLRVAPDHPPSLQMKAAIDFAQGRPEQARQALRQVIQANPDNLAAAKLLAATQMQLGEAERAIETLTKLEGRVADDAQFLAMLGTAYLRDGRYLRGIEYLERASELDPQAAGVRTQLALGLLASGEGGRAVKELETAVDLGKDVLQAELMLTLIHLRNGDYQQALEQARIFAGKSPDSPVPHNLEGAAYLGLGRTEAAREAFRKALAKDAGFLPARMNLAGMNEKAGKSDAARRAYMDVLERKPGHAGALMALARLAGSQGREEEASKYLQKAFETNPDILRPGLELIRYYDRKGQALRVISIARQMLKQHPDNPTVLNVLGLAQMRNEDFHGALASFQKLQRRVPDSSQSFYLQGRAYLALERRDEARRAFEQALALAGDHVPTQLELARLELKAGNRDVAIRLARTIREQRPDDELGYRLEGEILLDAGQPEAAAKIFEQGLQRVASSRLVLGLYSAQKQGKALLPWKVLAAWLEKHPDDFVVASAYAEALRASGDLKGAESLYLELLTKRPDDIVVLNNLAWISHRLGRGDALRHAERAYELAPDNPAVMDTLGWLLVGTGEVRRGLSLLEEAVVKAPHLAEIRYHLGVALHRIGQDGRAASELKQALDMDDTFPEADEARRLLKKI